MISDSNQFCFIICTNDRLYLEECMKYISLLEIPYGYTIDILTIEGADSMTSAYNTAMRESPAKYKIYLHQDTMILNKYYLYNILKIFKSDEDIGMIGMGGNVHLESDALISCDLSKYVGNNMNKNIEKYISYKMKDDDYIYDVEVIDGFIMATQYDIPWRDDLFDGWDFYDLSQSMEFHRLDFRVVVPEQFGMEWCFHADDLTSTLYEYEKYRKLFQDEYAYDLQNYDLERKEEKIDERKYKTAQNRIKQYILLENYSKEFKNDIKRILDKADDIIKKHDVNEMSKFGYYIDHEIVPQAIYRVSVDIRRFHHTIIALNNEMEKGLKSTIDDIKDFKDLKNKYIKCQFMLRRIEMDFPGQYKDEAMEFLTKDTISPFYISVILGNEYSMFSQTKRIMTELCQKYLEIGDVKRTNIAIELFK